MSNVTESQYSLGYNGSYATVECLNAKNLEFQNVAGGAGSPKVFSPHLKMVKNMQSNCYELSIIFYAPSNFVLDPKSAIVGDYMGAEFFIFVNLKETESPSTPLQCFNFNVCFTQEFSQKLRWKKVFVIPVHGDPEEGEVGQTVIGGEEEID